MKVLLAQAHLSNTCDLERGVAMSTLIASDEWVLEADYKDGKLGDVRLYRNQDANDVNLETGVRNRGEYWGSVPTSQVKCYRFLDGEPDASGKFKPKVAFAG